MDLRLPLRRLLTTTRYCPSCLHPQPLALTAHIQTRRPSRPFSSTSSTTHQREHAQDPTSDRASRPRWQSTPAGMSLPFRVRPKPKNNEWVCNEDPAKVDAMYRRLLGDSGDLLLTEEVKWLAITHKSFDQGRRGFNDRLSYLGKRIVDLQTSMALVASPESPLKEQSPDRYGRVPFQHPQLSGLSNLSEATKAEVLSKQRMAQLAGKYGITGVLRWKPKKADNLVGSGLELVVSQALYAIVGAISLEKGGEVANTVVREKILAPLGIAKI